MGHCQWHPRARGYLVCSQAYRKFNYNVSLIRRDRTGGALRARLAGYWEVFSPGPLSLVIGLTSANPWNPPRKARVSRNDRKPGKQLELRLGDSPALS